MIFSYYFDFSQDIVHMPTYLEKIDATKHPQPFLLVLYSESVLKPSSVFVIIEKNTIPQPSLLKAIDVCYKAHFILDCKYQQLCTSVWKFFERYIFNQPGIPTNKDSPTLRALRAFLAFRNFPWKLPRLTMGCLTFCCLPIHSFLVTVQTH